MKINSKAIFYSTWNGEEKKFIYDENRKTSIDGKFSIDQKCSFHIGSDRYAAKIGKISISGRAILVISDFRKRVYKLNKHGKWIYDKSFWLDDRYTTTKLDPSF